MQRRPISRKSSSDVLSGGGHGSSRSKRSASNNNKPSFTPFLPKSLIGTLVILGAGAILVLLARLNSSSSSSSLSKEGTRSGNENLRINKKPAITKNANSIIETVRTTPSDPIGIASPATNATLHIIFSTDCGTFQHWQSYLFFHAAHKVQQPGYVTRIASGCTDKELKDEKEWHEKHIQSVMSDRFRVHFTPHFSGVKDEETGEVKGDYKFFNKPFGLKHFLENNDLLGFVDGTKEMKHPDDIIILTDPDFLLLRPLTDDFSDTRETLIGGRRKAIYEKKESHYVTHGSPYAQTYGLGTQWRKFDLDAIAGADSPAKDVNQADGGLYFPVGPPYIGTAKDMYNISLKWSEFAPRVHKQYPHLLAEMYAYCIAAAHLGLPHMLIDSMMVSASGLGGEGWKFVKEIPGDEMCTFASHPDHSVHPLPSVIHFCQHYGVDKYFWGKRKVPHKIFTCEHPLLVEPPMDLGSGKYLSFVPKGRPESQKKELSPEKAKMEAFMVCALTSATNDAMVTFKKNHCDGGGNMEKTHNMWG